MFKSLADALEPDERYRIVMTEESDGSWRPMTLADHHAAIDGVDVPAHAPDDIRSMFNRARHALLYSWFDYELSPLAEQQAFATLEAALRRRFPDEKGALYRLAERAVAEGTFEPMWGNSTVSLPKALSMIRNQWAHGSANFAGPGASLGMLRDCAELISRLYPLP